MGAAKVGMVMHPSSSHRLFLTSTCADRYSSQFENNYFTEMCSGSEAGSYVTLTDFVYHQTLGLRVIKKKKREDVHLPQRERIFVELMTSDRKCKASRQGTK